MEQTIKDAIISNKKKVTPSMVKQLSCNRLSQYESYKYLKKININKFGICKFKE